MNGFQGLNWNGINKLSETFGIYKLLAEHVTTSIETSFDLDLIGKELVYGKEYLLSFSWLRLVVANLELFLNDNITESNYETQALTVSGTTTTAFRRNDARISDGTSNYWQCGDVKITVLSDGTVVYKSDGITDINGSIAIRDMATNSLFTVTDIEKLTIESSASSGIGVGSTFKLYEIGGA